MEIVMFVAYYKEYNKRDAQHILGFARGSWENADKQ